MEIKARLGLGRVFSWIKKFKKSKEQYKLVKILEKDFQEIRGKDNSYVFQGDRYFENENYIKAIESYKMAPRSGISLVKIGTAYLKIYEPGKAVEYFKDALEYTPENIEIRILYADALSQNKYFVENGMEYQGLLGVPKFGEQLWEIKDFDIKMKQNIKRWPDDYYMADYIKELASQTGINMEGITKTIEGYNRV